MSRHLAFLFLSDVVESEERDAQWIAVLANDPLVQKLNNPVSVNFFMIFGTLRSSNPERRKYENLTKSGRLIGEFILEKFGDSPGDVVEGSFDLKIR